MPTRVLHIKQGSRVATFTIHGDWKLAKNVHLPQTHLPRVKTTRPASGAGTSGNWSGYVAIAKAGHNIRYVTANFNVPNLNCAASTPGPQGSWYSDWTGLDGWLDGTVEQQGTEAYCNGGSQGLYVFYEMYPAGPIVFTGASPGDAVQSDTYFNPTTHVYTLQVKDLTQSGAGVTENIDCAATCSNTSAEVVSEAPGGGPPDYGLADYGADSYTNVGVTSVSGTKGNLTANSLWTVDSIKMVSQSTDDVLSTAGSVQGGTAFLATWKAPL
jgi:hypothetical protein